MLQKPANTQVPIHELLARRWSPRAFDHSKPVSRAQLLALLEAARWAPSCFGDEPWRFVVCDRNQDKHAWEQAFDCLSDGNKIWTKNAPVLILAVADSVMRHDGSPNRWAQYDTGAASISLALQAVALGLAAHQMGGFDVEKTRNIFHIPLQCTPMAMIAVGYQAAPEALPPQLREKELAERKRRPLSDNFFAGDWKTPITK